MKEEIKQRIEFLKERREGYRGQAVDLAKENEEKLRFLERLYEALYL